MKANIGVFSLNSINREKRREKVFNFFKDNSVSIGFLVLSIIGLYFSGLSITFVTNEVITRFIRNGILVLALIIPIRAGMGLNFAITMGALCTQAAIVLALNWSIEGVTGILTILSLSVIFSILIGYFIGLALNRARGKEMITSIIIGFLGNSLFQMIFLIGFGSIIPIKNKTIGLSRGIGIRDMVDLGSYRRIFSPTLTLNIGGIDLPLHMIGIVIFFGIGIHYILNTPFGQQIKAVGGDYKNSSLLGVNGEKIRIKAVIISTVLASIGQFIYLQNIGIANVYTAQSNSDIFSSAAILAGGASIKKASVKNVFLGIFLFHALFIVSPQAGQNIFNNAALGEYFRSFIAYGTIALAIIINLKKNKYNPS